VRILIVCYEFPPIGGGVGSWVSDYVNRLPSRGVECDLVTSSPSQEDHIDFMPGGASLHRLNVRKKALRYWTQREAAEFVLRAATYCSAMSRTRRYDLCHAVSGFPSGMVAWLLRRRLPYVLSLEGSDVPGFNPRLVVQYVLLKPLFRSIWRHARVVAAHSRLQAAMAKRTAELNYRIIPNAIDFELFSKAERSEADGLRVLVVGRLNAAKAIEDLIDGFALVSPDLPRATLTIAGDGPERSALATQSQRLGLSDRVRFLGFVEHDRIADVYRDADVFVLPSLTEGMPVAVLEAMASGLPVVFTDTGGAEELLNGNGCLIPKRDPKAIAGVLKDLASDRQRRTQMGKRSRSIASAYAWDNVMAQYISLYEQVIQGESRS